MDTMLLHACCPLCACGTIEQLKSMFDITVYYYNPNIHPKTEYEKRRDDSKIHCKKMGIRFIAGPYEQDTTQWHTLMRGLEYEPEGGKRCLKCFTMRLAQVARYAAEHGFDVFGTTLTIGRQKKAEIINTLGAVLAKKYFVRFFEADFKKNNGEMKACQIAKQENLYRQYYCGCIYSKQERDRQNEQLQRRTDANSA